MTTAYRSATWLVVLLVAIAAALALAGCSDRQAGGGEVEVLRPEGGPEPGGVVEIEEAEARPAPEFTLAAAGGGEVSLSDYAGKALILDFWATSCTGCVEELPEFQALYDSWDHEKVEYLGVSLDSSIEVVEAFMASREELSLPMALGDDAMIDAYLGRRRTIPAARVIDGEGMIRYEFGPGPSTDQVGAAVERLLAEVESGSGG